MKFIPMIFNNVKAGSFLMGNEKVSVQITKDFEMQATLITQLQWVEIMHHNPSNFIDSKSYNNPVEQVSYEDVQQFLKVLNLSKKDGYNYRLPTEAEWEFVVRGRGKYNSLFHFGDKESDLIKYAWYEKNSKNKTHSVAQLKPLIIDDKEFYDMHGNVWEWVQDWYDKLEGDKDPKGPKKGSNRVIRGGSWNNNAQYLRSANRVNYGPANRYSYVGFRLVRTKI